MSPYEMTQAVVSSPNTLPTGHHMPTIPQSTLGVAERCGIGPKKQGRRDVVGNLAQNHNNGRLPESNAWAAHSILTAQPFLQRLKLANSDRFTKILAEPTAPGWSPEDVED
jgi:hypothetical protein